MVLLFAGKANQHPPKFECNYFLLIAVFYFGALSSGLFQLRACHYPSGLRTKGGW